MKTIDATQAIIGQLTKFIEDDGTTYAIRLEQMYKGLNWHDAKGEIPTYKEIEEELRTMAVLLSEEIKKVDGKFTDLNVRSGMLDLVVKKIGDPKHPHFLRFEIIFTLIQAKSYPYVDVVKSNRKKFRGR